jgi:hypothetical protein
MCALTLSFVLAVLFGTACSSNTTPRADGEIVGDVGLFEGPRTTKVVDSRPLERWITEDGPLARDGGAPSDASRADGRK